MEFFIVAGMCVFAFFAGMMPSNKTIKKCKKRIAELQNEKVYYNAEKDRLLSDIESIKRSLKKAPQTD